VPGDPSDPRTMNGLDVPGGPHPEQDARGGRRTMNGQDAPGDPRTMNGLDVPGGPHPEPGDQNVHHHPMNGPNDQNGLGVQNRQNSFFYGLILR
jgi:hypothetical protein